MLLAQTNTHSKQITQKLISEIVSKILEANPSKTPEEGQPIPTGADEALSIELLQLATLLVRFMKKELIEHRKVVQSLV